MGTKGLQAPSFAEQEPGGQQRLRTGPMPDSSMKRGATLCLALAIGPGSTLADDSLGHRDNISTGLNQRQKAEMKVPPGFVEGSTLNGFLRNY
ncbi:hypothetical protein PAMH19_5888 [Pseudomonas aeruginosa]|nr:hypothetical protein PAMH19_5888 [Pseudomonas aeruginosa]